MKRREVAGAFAIVVSLALLETGLAEIRYVSLSGGHVSLLDLNGREFLQQPYNGRQKTIDISTLQQGIYIVKVTGKRTVQVGKLVR